MLGRTKIQTQIDLGFSEAVVEDDGPRLLQQVIATFDHRGTTLPDGLPLALTNDFASSSDSQAQWKAFIRRNDAVDAPEQFGQVVQRLRAFLYPILQAAAQKDGDVNTRWDPDREWAPL